MFDIKLIRENSESVKAGLKAKGVSLELEGLLELDQNRRQLQVRVDDLRSQKNLANDEISRLLKEKKDPKEKISQMKRVTDQIDELEPKIKELEIKINGLLISVPNLAHASVPIGRTDQNKIIRTWGQPKRLDFKPRSHIEIAENLDIIDFKRAAKISGSNFVLFKNEGAQLERALFNFMLDLHTQEHGYKEVFPPFLVNAASMTGTGQLPKMKEDMYRLHDEELYLIPTAEVPVTNIFREEILNEEDLPIYLTAYSACFRREAGSYGKDTRGLIRVHQFDKVELVKFVKPQTSYEELEKLVGNAEVVLQRLGLPFRVVLLASGDLSFASSKTYDLEAYAAGIDQWLEVSSCSNFEDFQARRCNIRFKGKQIPKPTFVHTLNGSGVALARTVIAILENYQTPQGEVVIPDVLQPYMNGTRIIRKK